MRHLRAAGLVHSRRDGKMVMYALTDAGARACISATVGASSTQKPMRSRKRATRRRT